jgi:sugar/nucleoside kinase (ribokinase family)
MGAEGSYVQSRTEQVYVPAFEANVVDTSGAGDAWVAGFLAGIVKGWDLESAARLGSATGARCVTAIGTTTGLGSFDETVAFMRTARTLPGMVS